MKKRSCILLFTTLLVLLSACGEDPSGEGGLSPTASVSLVVTTRADGSEADGAVTRLRLVVTGYTAEASGTVSFNRLVESPDINTGFNVKARKGDNNFYLIANETPEMTTVLDAAKTAADVEQLKIMFRPPKTGELPVMFGTREKVAVVANDKDVKATVNYTDDEGKLQTGQSTLPLTLTRASGKFSVTFIKKANDFTVKNINFKVLRIPSYSYLGTNRTYPGTTWSTETLPQNSITTLTSNNTATWNNSTGEYTYGMGDKISFADFYLPEHLPTDTHRGDVDYSTVLLVNGTCVVTGGREQDANWQVNLMADGFQIKRNTHYKVAVSITGMGAMGMAAEVMAVEEHEIPVNWGVGEGLVVVSDQTADYGQDRNVANDVNACSGLLKVVKILNGTKTFYDALFKYGSVVAIATNSAGAAYNPDADVLYKPIIAGSSYQLSSWAVVPAATGTSTVSNTLAGLKQGLGDPCQLIGVTSTQMAQGRYSNGLWHTATPEELQRLIENGDVQGGISAADSRGWLAFSELLVPVSGYRNTAGQAVAAGGQGRYWSNGESNRFLFTATPSQASLSIGDRQEAYTVRCIRNNLPESKITAANTTVGYAGGSFTVPVNANVPHWRVEVITAANNNGDVTNVGDPSGVTLQSTSGSYTGNISVTMPRRILSTDRTCYLRITGTGYDGTMAKRIVTLLQNRLEWKVAVESNTMNSAGDRLPGAGGTYTAVVKVTPQDAAVFPADAKCVLTVSASGSATETEFEQAINKDTQTASITYTVSENPLNDIRQVNLNFKISGTGMSCSTSQSKIQAKK